jgi:putative NADH-flavin reductase
MRITVFGASGRTGRLLVADALARGWEVAAVARRPPDQPLPPKAAAIVGSPANEGVVAGAIAGSQAVVSALGPVAEVTVTEVSEATAVIAHVLQQDSVRRRFVLPANASVFSDAPVSGRYANVAAEHRRNVAMVRSTAGLAWTVVAAPVLTNDPATGRIDVVLDAMPAGRTLTRGDFAATMLDGIANDAWTEHVVGAANPD